MDLDRLKPIGISAEELNAAFIQLGISAEELNAALLRLAEGIRKIFEKLADCCFSFRGFTEDAEQTRRKIDTRERERKRFAEWNWGEDQRRTAEIRQYERVSIMPGGRQYFRTQHRARKPP